MSKDFENENDILDIDGNKESEVTPEKESNPDDTLPEVPQEEVQQNEDATEIADDPDDTLPEVPTEVADNPDDTLSEAPQEEVQNLDEALPEVQEDEARQDVDGTDTEEPSSEEENEEESQQDEPDTAFEEIPREEPPAKKAKKNSFHKFLKKFRLPLIIAAAALLVAAAITTTILILNAPKFFVREATDFVEAPNKRQVVYVLKDDITVDGDLVLNNGLDIDLNGHTLTINGAFKRAVDSEAEMNIGTLKKKQYIAEGKLVAGSVNITAASGVMNIYCPSEISGAIRIKQLNLFENATVSQSKKLSFTGTSIAAHKEIKGEVQLTATSSLELKAAASLDILSADATSSAIIYGKINDKISGGGEISLLGSAICPNISNVTNLYLQQATVTLGTAVNIENVFVVTQLDKPAELNVERTGATFKCVAAKVNGADIYVFTIKDGDRLIAAIPSATNVCDISAHITQPKTYTISVKASSSNPRINLPSEELVINYNYSIKLESPVLSVAPGEGGKIMLSFPKVNFATVYKISINGEQLSVDAPDIAAVSVDITNYVSAAGTYTIKVTASYPGNASFIESDTVMISYVTVITLDAPEITIERVGDKLNVGWQAVPNAKNYVISSGAGYTVTSATGISLNIADIADNTTFSLYAQGIGYYNNSATATKVYQFTQLVLVSQPEYTLIGDVLSVSMPEVAGAESYTLIINGEEAETSANPEFSVTASAGDTFSIVAAAAYCRPVSSNTITIA
ncbi:MAG: hypothetical protein PHC84_02695 [Clostridia bacterium]|nr:hypothetical protein [Clostridia bacterium]